MKKSRFAVLVVLMALAVLANAACGKSSSPTAPTASATAATIGSVSIGATTGEGDQAKMSVTVIVNDIQPPGSYVWVFACSPPSSGACDGHATRGGTETVTPWAHGGVSIVVTSGPSPTSGVLASR